MTRTTEPPIAALPPFVLPDLHGRPFNTARLRGRRHTILLFLSPEDGDAAVYLASFAARREELAWLHAAVVAVIPAGINGAAFVALPFTVLRDGGEVRSRILPDVAPDVAALLVADQYGQVAAWRTARRVVSLPDVDTALTWAWEVARPKGSCGGATWPAVAQPAAPPAPVGRFRVGARPRQGYRRGDRPE